MRQLLIKNCHENRAMRKGKLKEDRYFRILTTESLDEVERYLTERIGTLKEPFGVLLLLYTVVCTKGISGMRAEMSDPTEPIIDSTYGYGSQSLINLMLTGRAVGHVWDHDQDVGGLSELLISSIMKNH